MAITTAKQTVPSRNKTAYYGAGSAAGDILFTLSPHECDKFDSYVFLSTTGVVTVEVALNPAATRWSNPVALQDMAGTLIDQAAVTTNLNLYGLVGRFNGLRVKASGAAADCDMVAWSTGKN